MRVLKSIIAVAVVASAMTFAPLPGLVTEEAQAATSCAPGQKLVRKWYRLWLAGKCKMIQ